MQGKFRALTLSYKNAPIAVREAVALNEIGCRNLLDKVKEFTTCSEAMVLSTCNRTEVYYVAEKEHTNELIKLIALEKGFVATKKIRPYFKALNNQEEAMTHLFRVALGLESQVVGDVQILNQVKNAYQWAIESNAVGSFLHRLLHSVFNANKQAVNSTNFRDGAASVSYATVEMVEELTAHIEEPRVLLIGVGDIGRDVCLNFQKSRISHITIVNRTHHKAVELAQRVGASTAYWENVWQEMDKADVVISSVPGDCFFISEDKIKNTVAAGRERIFLDLSMPRSIDVVLENIPGVAVYNIDAIHNRTTEALALRLASIPAVEQIVAEAIAEFQTWVNDHAFTPIIQQFKNHLEQIRQQELARYVKKLNPEEAQLVEAVTQSMLNKIIKLPAVELKAACQRGNISELSESLVALFNLEKETCPKS
ncbi:glutamyl-tRNA reductase [Pontibacter cellulosilyticus]|uniref:Glutamyl-tRNA reductase n=1 Tax=Pontibacter cellulosilyticus TaxID=1720253 RepID=A0A923SI01_9BACT|nr:glutamyl-tRNA reductase [Pontibacter cellulosilyticus]MBC5992289.1 glutamyl-tRNA reductase [Pontibacter cellulosilyticus]